MPSFSSSNFDVQQLDDQHAVRLTRLPDCLVPTPAHFDRLFRMHPAEFPTIKMAGRTVRLPRWQLAFGRDYQYSAQTSLALPVPDAFRPYLNWAATAVDARLNGLLVNWYDLELGHYIGQHRDDTKTLAESPIVIISLGVERVFRMRNVRERKRVDFTVQNGDVLVLPLATNVVWTHGVPRRKCEPGRRISITIRSFKG